MRLIHTADWHLGHELHGFDRGLEHDAFLGWLADEILDREVDALVVAGDVYDTVNPPVPAQQRLYRFLHRVLGSAPGLQVMLLGGNHDSASRLELPRALLCPERVHLVGAMPRHENRLAPVRVLIELRDRQGRPGAICAAVPYLRPGDLPPANESERPVRALYRQVCEAANAIPGKLPLILTGHLHVSGGEVSTMSERRIVIGGEEVVAADIFPDCAAYVALGHLHRPQQVQGSCTIRYAGSPFPLSVTERDYRHGVVLLELDHGGVTSLEQLRGPRLIEFLRVPAQGTATLAEVEAELRRLELPDPGQDRRTFLEVAVRLEHPEPDLRRRIDEALKGKPVRLTRVTKHTTGQDGALRAAVATLGDLDPVEVFARRHLEEHGTEPPDALLRAFKEVLAGVQSPNDEPMAEIAA